MASTYLSRTVGATATNKNKVTVSLWFKRSKLGAENTLIGGTMTSNNRWKLRFKSDDTLDGEYGSGGSWYSLVTNRKFRDTSFWYHLVYQFDSTQGTSSNRVKIWINGVQETSFGTANYPPQNDGNYIVENSAKASVGTFYDGSGYHSSHRFDGSMSHVHVIDGTAYDASAFGSTDATTGEWKINTAPSVTYGTNGFFILKDTNSGTDQSPNTNNLTVSGTLTKTEDNPSNVFSTLMKEPSRTLSGTPYRGTLTNGNTKFDATGNTAGSISSVSSLGATSGKYYMEAQLKGNNSHARIGVATIDGYNGTSWLGNSSDNNYALYQASDGAKYVGSSSSSYGASYAVDDIIGVAMDLDNNTVTFYKNGATQGSISITDNDKFKHFHVSGYDNTGSDITRWLCNFGNGYFGSTQISSEGTNASGIGKFEFDVPANHSALSTKGMNL